MKNVKNDQKRSKTIKNQWNYSKIMKTHGVDVVPAHAIIEFTACWRHIIGWTHVNGKNTNREVIIFFPSYFYFILYQRMFYHGFRVCSWFFMYFHVFSCCFMCFHVFSCGFVIVNIPSCVFHTCSWFAMFLSCFPCVFMCFHGLISCYRRILVYRF